MITKGAHHVSLTVDDIDTARGFYGELLGLPEIERPNFGFAGAWYQAGSIQLHLIVPPPGHDVGTNAAKLTPLANHVAFEVEDPKAVLAQLQEAGLRVEYVDGETDDDERRRIFRYLNDGDLDYICNIQVVERGVDIPRIGCIQLCVAM